MKRILGIDPGSRVTGYGIVDTHGGKTSWVGSGCIRISGDSLAERLQQLCSSLNEILDTHGPDEVAIEQVFVSRNVDSALKLGQARGAAISVVAMRHIPVHEYTARQVKKAVVGKGNAEKSQVQHMIVRLLSLTGTPPEDAADALAVAMCHAHTGATVQQLTSILDKTMRTRRGRLR